MIFVMIKKKNIIMKFINLLNDEVIIIIMSLCDDDFLSFFALFCDEILFVDVIFIKIIVVVILIILYYLNQNLKPFSLISYDCYHFLYYDQYFIFYLTILI